MRTWSWNGRAGFQWDTGQGRDSRGQRQQQLAGTSETPVGRCHCFTDVASYDLDSVPPTLGVPTVDGSYWVLHGWNVTDL